MKIAFIIFNGITWLDFIGMYDPITRLKSMGYLPNLKWDICAFSTQVKDNFGLEITPQKVKPPLQAYDMIFVPGGFGTRKLIENRDFISWLKEAGNAGLKVSVCTGSLLLGAAGFLKGKKATTNYQEFDLLKPYCASVVKDRIVEDGNVITAGAVSSSIDLGLYICEKLAGLESRKAIQKKMDYRC